MYEKKNVCERIKNREMNWFPPSADKQICREISLFLYTIVLERICLGNCFLLGAFCIYLFVFVGKEKPTFLRNIVLISKHNIV